jgi:transcriptional regulator with XRE-family HTH domain
MENSKILPIMELEKIGKLVRQRREILGLKQEDLAEISGVAIKTIYTIELGKGNPSFVTLTNLLEVLGMEVFVQIKKS